MPHRSVPRKTARQRQRWRGMLTAIVAVAIAASSLVGSTPAQAANITDGFNPGKIIADDLFYDGSAMSTAAVQTFLNQKVARCIIGDPGYKPGDLSPNGTGNRIATSCLKDFKMTTQSRPADKYCKAYAGAKNETAAQIIAKVGQACGISQRVILIMLEKEQSLVSDSWPVTRQYDYAMGMDCPDSGPGNSANCDASGAGFFQQVLRGTRQLQVYRLNPNSFGYQPYKTHTIQWHPDSSCGTSRVKIENQATSALYIYTPYRPNQAALNAGWGEGNGCSTYGNRNFYNFYKSWFGDPLGAPAFPITGDMRTYWNANKSWLGEPTGAAKTVASGGGGKLQYFTGGFMYRANNGAPVGFTKNSPIISAFGAAGGIEGSWGWPLSPAVSQGSGNSVVRFQGGAVVETKSVGVFLVPEATRPAWEATGGYTGRLGYPRASATSISSEGTSQTFKGGTLYNSAKQGVVGLVSGQISTAFSEAGGPKGAWGWPRGRQVCRADGTQCQADFAAGVATWTKANGTVFSHLPSDAETKPVKPGSGESVKGGAA